MAFRAGDRVRQQAFGVGDIVEISSQYVTISFDDGSTRKFVTSIVRLDPSSVPRPAGRKAAGRAKRKRAV